MTPQEHIAELVQTRVGHTRYTCYVCDQYGESRLQATNGNPVPSWLTDLLDPATAFAKIVDHLTSDRAPADTAEVVDAAAMLVALANDIEPGVAYLAERLPRFTIAPYDERTDEQ